MQDALNGMPLRHALSSPQPSEEPLEAPTPLRRSQFESELALHPDKAWVSWLLQGIDNGVQLGYTGPHTSFIARNLHSAHQRPDINDKELQQDLDAGCILGPFADKPLPTLHCSGLGVVPKKNGKWWVKLHKHTPLCNWTVVTPIEFIHLCGIIFALHAHHLPHYI